ncbi:zinc ribbon domain-containing protein, partial [Photorhabdus bodei]|uniref:zinc ribbon domain-containing protein n=1 Tax=Photorhabdus bodei TaxID=2029681 RepID=UPI0032B77D41
KIRRMRSYNYGSFKGGVKKYARALLNVPANRTHKFKIDSVRSQTFTYYCSCQQHELTLRRHNKILRGESHYICQKCGERLIVKSIDSFNPNL